jgi:hypothetical protein
VVCAVLFPQRLESGQNKNTTGSCSLDLRRGDGTPESAKGFAVWLRGTQEPSVKTQSWRHPRRTPVGRHRDDLVHGKGTGSSGRPTVKHKHARSAVTVGLSVCPCHLTVTALGFVSVDRSGPRGTTSRRRTPAAPWVAYADACVPSPHAPRLPLLSVIPEFNRIQSSSSMLISIRQTIRTGIVQRYRTVGTEQARTSPAPPVCFS